MLGGDKLPKEERREIIWNASSTSHLDPKEEQREIIWNASSMSHLNARTAQCDKEVQRITHLHKIASQLPDAFIDTAKVTKSYIPTTNTPARINIPIGKIMTSLKRGQPLGSKDLIPRKRKIYVGSHPSSLFRWVHS